MERLKCNNLPIIIVINFLGKSERSYYAGIMLYAFKVYYAQNYAGIIRQGLPGTHPPTWGTTLHSNIIICLDGQSILLTLQSQPARVVQPLALAPWQGE